MSRVMGLTLPPITEGLSAATSPLWQALVKRRGQRPVYLLGCLQAGTCPDLALLPKPPGVRAINAAIERVQATQPGTYAGAVTLYRRMWAACRIAKRPVLTRPEVFAMMAREASEKAMLKYLRALVVADLVVHTRGQAVHWYEPATLTSNSALES